MNSCIARKALLNASSRILKPTPVTLRLVTAKLIIVKSLMARNDDE